MSGGSSNSCNPKCYQFHPFYIVPNATIFHIMESLHLWWGKSRGVIFDGHDPNIRQTQQSTKSFLWSQWFCCCRDCVFFHSKLCFRFCFLTTRKNRHFHWSCELMFAHSGEYDLSWCDTCVYVACIKIVNNRTIGVSLLRSRSNTGLQRRIALAWSSF